MCSYLGPGEDYHDDFDKNLDGPCGGWSDIGWTTQCKGWTSSAYEEGKWKQLQRFKLVELSLQLPILPTQPPFVGHR
jgi:hypothetical protein